MKFYNYDTLMFKEPTKLGEQVNQFGQMVQFFEHPTKGDTAPVIGVIHQCAFDTDFYDLGDFYDGSDYNFCMLPDGEIKCFFQL